MRHSRIYKLSDSDVLTFISSAPTVILQVGTSFNSTVKDHFGMEARTRLGLINSTDINMHDWAVAAWVRHQQVKLGQPVSQNVLEGYYLFLNGEINAYHPCTIDLEKDTISLGIGAIGAIIGIIAGSSSSISLALQIAQAEAGQRVTKFFDEVIANWKAAQKKTQEDERRRIWEEFTRNQARRQAAIDQESLNASFSLLGVNPNSTFEQVRVALRKCTRQWHPDQFRDEGTKKLAQEKMAEINAAYNLILVHRNWR